jgi:4-amino-4-deoxy-L-arabinose transferase-like glycosyltransferase
MTALYFAAKYQGGKEFADAMLDSQIHGRMEKQRSLLYYFYKAFGVYSLSYTMAFFLVVLNVKRIFNLKNNETDSVMIRSLLAWGLVILLGLSIPGTKHTRYILPAAPAFALIAAFIFARTDKSMITAPLRLFLSRAGMILPFALTTLMIAASIILGIFSIALSLNVFLVIILFTLVSLSLVFCFKKFKETEDRDMIAFSHGIISFLILVIFVVEPLQQWMESSKEFVKVTEAKLDAASQVYFYRTGPDGEDLKYLVNVKRKLKPEFISSEEDIAMLKPNDIIIIPAKELDAMSKDTVAGFSTVFNGKMGHEPFVSVMLKAETAVK